jgi:hypothetical protein
MKISKRTREQAAMICAIAASTPNERGSRPCYDVEVAQWLGLWRGTCVATYTKEPAVRLALDAWEFVFDRGERWTAETDADAEALLRTGWVPK